MAGDIETYNPDEMDDDDRSTWHASVCDECGPGIGTLLVPKDADHNLIDVICEGCGDTLYQLEP